MQRFELYPNYKVAIGVPSVIGDFAMLDDPGSLAHKICTPFLCTIILASEMFMLEIERKQTTNTIHPMKVTKSKLGLYCSLCMYFFFGILVFV